MNNSKIYDVGCGFGDLYTFLNKKKIKFDYTGLDINKNFLEFARKKNARFIQFDLRKDKIPKADWIISSGVFNHKKTTDYTFIKKKR